MAQTLTEASWTGFTKKQKLDLDDGALVKALSKLDKTGSSKPDQTVAALADVAEQIKKQVAALAKRKKELGDKPFNEVKGKLYDVPPQPIPILTAANGPKAMATTVSERGGAAHRRRRARSMCGRASG